MANRIKGITVEINGDVTKLDAALRDVNKEINLTQGQLKDVERLLKLDPTNTTLLAQKQQLLTQAIENTSKKLEALQEAERQAQEQFKRGEISQAQYQGLQREIVATEQNLAALERQAKDTANDGLEELENQARETGDELEEAGEKTSGLSDKLKSGLAAAAKIGAVAIMAAATAIATLAKASLVNYAEYEQLVGGVETLFSQSADTVTKYAENAYKTAGLSANEYLETVTGFSASLLQSLGGDTDKAARMADQAITDMADNANKMGTSMESIQNAYQGFAKANYTMLDNLKLGYGGTKEEMERLLADATALSGVKYDISSYADIVEAIHVVQTELGITGTTALEASETISGSVASAKSAWKNLVTGIADQNADMSGLITNFVDSVLTAGNNIVPRVQQILAGISGAVGRLAPIIGETVPQVVGDVLPSLVSAGVDMVIGLTEGFTSAAPALLEAGLSATSTLNAGISQSLPKLIPTAVSVVLELVETLVDNADLLVDAAIAITLALTDGIIAALPILLEKAPEIIAKLVIALLEARQKLNEAAIILIATLLSGIISNLPRLHTMGTSIVLNFIQGIVNKFGELGSTGGEIIGTINNGITQRIDAAVQWGKDLISKFINGIELTWDDLKSTASGTLEIIQVAFFGFLDWFQSVFTPVWAAIIGVAQTIFLTFQETITTAWTLITSAFQIFCEFLQETFGVIWTNVFTAIQTVIETVGAAIQTAIGVLSDVFSGFVAFLAESFLISFQNTIQGVLDFFVTFKDNIVQIVDWIKQSFQSIIDFIGGVFTDGWKKAWQGVQDIFRGIFEALVGIAKVPLNGIIDLLNIAIDAINIFIRGINRVLEALAALGVYIPQIPELSKIEYLAKGGILEAGSAIVGEKGPELLSLVNGKARVTPLTNSGGGAQNTAASAAGVGGYNQTLNFYTAAMSPAEVARQTRNATRQMLAKARG